MKPQNDRPWSVPLLVDEIPETGQRIELTADEATRAALAELTGLRSLPRLTASFDVNRHGVGGAHVSGVVSGIVGQNCVVTLEPIENPIDELVDVTFAPGEQIAEPEGEEEDVAPISDETPEAIVDGRIDLGAIATEFLLLGIDPYPRKAGAVFEAPATPDDPSSHPFSALAALKNRSQPDEK